MKMPPVRIEAEAWSDPKFPHLARLLGLGDGHFAIIKVAIIWAWQAENYTEESPCFVVPESVVEMALGEGSAPKLVRAGLAKEDPDGYFITGSNHKRTGWLFRERQKGKKGGDASAAAKRTRKPRNKVQPVVDPASTVGEPQPDLLSSLFSVTDHPSGDPTLPSSQTASGQTTSPESHKPAVEAFDRGYREAADGAKPTWNGQTVGMVKKLVAKHGSAEVVTRIDRLFAGWLPWLTSVPDVKTLVGHFDKLVGAGPPTRAGPQLYGVAAAFAVVEEDLRKRQ